jgi:hypothetical protein
MVFESVDRSFCGVAAVDVRWSELVVDVLAAHELLEGGAGLVVEFLENRSESAG